jgi:predicted  nucleic acid-binding Zn-ribbon protein
MRKKYKWVFSFDQEGTGVATYQYFDVGIAARLVGSGWQVTAGVYSDIVDLEHLRCKMFNFGIGVHNGDTMKAYLSRNEFMSSMMKFMRFWKANKSSAFSHTPVYNAYIIGRGFMYYEDRENKKCFTDEEMDIIEILENVGFEFEDWTTMIVPEDIPELILAYQKITSDEIYLREMEKYKKSQGDLFNPAPKFKNRIRSGSEDNPEFGLTADEVQKNYHNKFNNPNSKDYDPDGFERYTRYGRKAVLPSKRPRKVGVMTKTSNDVVYTVEHRPKSEIEALKNNNISDTTYADECIRCHKIFEVSIDAAELVCPDCLGTEEDVKYFDEKVEDRKRKAVRIHKIPLRVRKEGERAYDFDETKSNWFEIGEEVDITTKSRTKRDKKVRYRKIYKPDGSAIEQYW